MKKQTRPKHQRTWKTSEIRLAVKLFMNGMEYEEITKHVPPFGAVAVEHKLARQGFTKEYRANMNG